jgi:hypothetical protein
MLKSLPLPQLEIFSLMPRTPEPKKTVANQGKVNVGDELQKSESGKIQSQGSH